MEYKISGGLVAPCFESSRKEEKGVHRHCIVHPEIKESARNGGYEARTY
jgi:hypothetical protein